MQVRPVTIDAGDAVELAEMLVFLRDWLAADHERLADSLGGFIDEGYDLDALRADLARFAFLLGDRGEGLHAGSAR